MNKNLSFDIYFSLENYKDYVSFYCFMASKK